MCWEGPWCGQSDIPPAGCLTAEKSLRTVALVEMDGKKFTALNNLS